MATLQRRALRSYLINAIRKVYSGKKYISHFLAENFVFGLEAVMRYFPMNCCRIASIR